MTDRPAILNFRRSARTDWRIWGMLAFGVAFTLAGMTLDPLKNCDESGSCAPWLVPIAAGIGLMLLLCAFAMLWGNPGRGSAIDPVTGELFWWQRRIGRGEGDSGRIHPSRIGAIRIERQSENQDAIHLFDLDGVRQPYFDEEVVPWRQERWIDQLRQAWPHIAVDIRE